ncbi:MAG: tetratricopeptide repeat protein [Myxococcota bacterium]
MQSRGDYEASIEPIRTQLASTPESGELQYLLGVALRRTGAPSLAIWPLLKAIEFEDWYWPAATELVASAMSSENYDLAFRITSEMIERDASRFDAWLLRAEARIARRGGYDEALADVAEALSLRPDSYAARVTQGSILLLLERPDEAGALIDALEGRADSTEPERAKLCVVKASLLEESGGLDAARLRLDACLATFPGDPLVVQTAVSMLERWGEDTRAREVLSRAIELAPESLPYRVALAARLRAIGRPTEGEALLQAVARDGETAAQRQAAWVALGDHHLALDRYGEAARAVGHALELTPDPGEAERLAYADLLAMAGEHEAARRAAARLERLEYRALIEARILLREEHPEHALEKLDAVLKIWPNNAALRYYAARAAEQTGDLRRAIGEYRASIRADAGFTDAGLRLARIHLARHEHQPAIRAAYHHLNTHPGNAQAALIIAEGLLGKDEPIPEELKGLLWSDDARPDWLALQTDHWKSRRGPASAIEFLERLRSELRVGQADDGDALRALIALLLETGRVKAARRAWTDAKDALQPPVRYALEGAILRAEGHVEAARAALSEAVRLDPADQTALAALAEVWLELDRPDQAVSCLDRAARASATPWRWTRRASIILSERGQLDAARERLDASLREHPHDAASTLLLAKICLRAPTCRDRVPELARRAAVLGRGREARALIADSDGLDPPNEPQGTPDGGASRDSQFH